MTAVEAIKADGAQLSIWRHAPSLDGARTAALGAFACDDAAAGAAIIRRAMDMLRQERFGAVIGPMDGDTWAKHRLVIDSDGRPPFLMEPANPPHFVEAFDRSGLKIVSRYLSSSRPSGALGPQMPPPAALRLRNFDPARATAELAAIHGVSLLAFAANRFYAPISLEAFLASYAPVLPAIDPDLVFLLEDSVGALQGFVFAIPDFAEGPRPRSVILKTYASRMKGGGSLLANAIHVAAERKGFAQVIHALMHESNLSATHSASKQGQVFRRYALWGGAL
jgi:hypothetical protein